MQSIYGRIFFRKIGIDFLYRNGCKFQFFAYFKHSVKSCTPAVFHYGENIPLGSLEFQTILLYAGSAKLSLYSKFV